ncbi:putative LPS assembly protein LptD [uncultured Alistipes sp.]|uniref:putative LPS assembly protein LptD n=1 Tax=uncultured Alistipes sp. TaxID=538949 RepID=UPI0025D9C3BC|nr:putative LPS assembly protein LptD [uncultured Alistipes sp.]
MDKFRAKYLFSATVILLFAQLVFGASVPWSMLAVAIEDTAYVIQGPIPIDSVQDYIPENKVEDIADPAAGQPSSRRERREQSRLAREEARRRAAFNALPQEERDSIFNAQLDSLVAQKADSLAVPQADTIARDSVKPPRKAKAFLDDPISGKNKDSLVYDVRNKMVYIYNEGDVTYQNSNLKADYMQINMETKMIYAYGKPDSLEGKPIITKPEFTEGDASYKMDTITYNLDSKKAMIKGVATQQGDGWLVGGSVKKMPDNTVNILHGKYTTCDHTDHPHFYLAMTKAKVIPGKKVVTGPAYLVMEDVPIYFLGIPEGFFPINSGPKSGLLMPTYGEEYTRGFFLRDMGYYFTLGDHADLALRGGFYTLGSWEASAASRYIKRYKYSGSFNVQYSNIKTGEKGEPDYLKRTEFRLQWTHSQDPKANPGSTFSASVNFATSGYSRYAASNINDILSTQTNSSISYSKNWAGTPFSLSMNMSVSQVSGETGSVSVTLPNVVFNVSRIYPFKRKEKVGKDRWYEKISMQYTGKMTNSVSTTEDKIFSKETFENMVNGVEHSIPISASFNLLNYINVSPAINYTEKWHFKRLEFEWNPMTNQVDTLPAQYGFYRLYNYSANVSASTTIYGMYDFTKKSRDRKIQAIRHTLTPSIGFSYAPDFGDHKYGYYKNYQADSTGRIVEYSPYSKNAYGVPGRGRSMSLNFSLSQTLEMKVLSKRDTSGVKKIKLIDELRISGSYNFLADSMGLSTIPISFRTTIIKNFGINLSMTLDPYRLTPDGKRYDKLFFPGRIVSTGWSFGYTFKSREDRTERAINDITSLPPEYMNPFHDPYGNMDPVLRRQYMSQAYYDFSLPWNFGFNYSVNYNISTGNYPPKGYKKNVTQTIGFNGSLNLTPKTGVTFQGGYDFKQKKLTTSSVSISRDLHCWQMSFSWVPFGAYRSWSFNIGVKAASLSDLKYDKSQSMYDNMY